jgi:ABC-type phosphate/phosphonate transport system permease subunit
MDDDRAATEGETSETPQALRPTPRPKRSRWRLVLIGVVLLPVLLIAAWTAIALNWNYSEGNRAGFVQKFSKKGWLCKTWEGEIAQVNLPGAAQQIFPFTVRDDSVAAEITRLMGSQVSLTYKEHRGVPGSCFGDTQYYVTAVKAIGPPAGVAK